MAAWTNLPLIQGQRKSISLKKGNPACYRLQTNREYLHGEEWKSQNENTLLSDTNIRRWRYGEFNPESIKKTILLVGETGTGKTTLINTMVNHMLGVKFEDKMWYEITEEEIRNQADCQTTAVTVYEIYLKDKPHSLTIIDTPGYGDTRGRQHDKDIPGLLLTLFKSYDGVNRLDSVGLVMKSSQNRLTDWQKYIFDAVLSAFAKDVEKNIVIFTTHSDGMPPNNALNAIKEAQTPCAKDKDGDPVYFMFNNRQSEQHKEDQKDQYQAVWQRGTDSLNAFFRFLKSTPTKNLRMTEEVLTKRMQLEACLLNLQQGIIMEETIQSEMKQTEEALKANKDKLDNNENFELEKTHREAVPIAKIFPKCKQLATRCTKCKENCHFPGCTVIGKHSLWLCDVMKKKLNGDHVCQVCTGQCSYKDHVKDDYIYALVTNKVKKTNLDVRKQLEDEYGKNVDLKSGIKRKLEDSKREESRLVDKAYGTIMKLQKIALKKEAMSTAVHLDFLIKKLKETGHPEKSEKLEEILKKVPPANPETYAFYKTLFEKLK